MKLDQPSSTALTVARGVYFLSLDHELGPLVPREEADLLARFIAAASPGSGWFLRWSARGWFRWLVCGFASLAAHGLIPFFGVRKRHIEALVREAIADGAEELVVIGAGYDALATR